MADPCVQGNAITRIEEKVDAALDSLRILAVQKNEIEHLIKNQEEHREWLKNHEKRMSALEQQAGKIAGKALYLLGGGAVTIICGLMIFAITK